MWGHEEWGVVATIDPKDQNNQSGVLSDAIDMSKWSEIMAILNCGNVDNTFDLKLTEAATSVGVPADAVQLVNTTDREAVGKFLALSQYIDVAIPRGGEGLIRRVAAEAAVFNRQLEDLEYSDLGGDLFGHCTLNIVYNEIWSKPVGIASIRIQCVSAYSTNVVRMAAGQFEFSSCNVQQKRHGIGTKVLWRIAVAAKARGFAIIEASGERAPAPPAAPTSIGYHVYPRLGFNARVGGRRVLDVAQDVVRIARAGLVARAIADKDGRDESIYLDVIAERAANGKSRADEMLDLYQGPWQQSVGPAFAAYSFNGGPR